MSDAFDDALRFVLRWEGGYANHPADPGGETYRGISRRAHPDWHGWAVLDTMADKDAQSLQLELAVRAFYRKRYWDPIYGDLLPPRVALAVFDWAVHSGVRHAVRALQRLVGAKVDGVMGPETLAATEAYIDRRAAEEIVAARRTFIRRLLAQRPALAVFEDGWENRIEGLARAIA